MGRDEHVVGVRIGENLHARFLQLHADAYRERAADDPRANREDQIERADIFMVGGEKPALEEARRVVVVIASLSFRRHHAFLFLVWLPRASARAGQPNPCQT